MEETLIHIQIISHSNGITQTYPKIQNPNIWGGKKGMIFRITEMQIQNTCMCVRERLTWFPSFGESSSGFSEKGIEEQAIAISRVLEEGGFRERGEMWESRKREIAAVSKEKKVSEGQRERSSKSSRHF